MSCALNTWGSSVTVGNPSGCPLASHQWVRFEDAGGRSFRLVVGPASSPSSSSRATRPQSRSLVRAVTTSSEGRRESTLLREKREPTGSTDTSSADRLYGDKGDDMIVGGAGPDRLYGGAGADLIKARDGHVDVLSCGSTMDVVTVDRGIASPPTASNRTSTQAGPCDRTTTTGTTTTGTGRRTRDDRRHDGRRNDRRHDDRRDHRQPVRPY